MLPDVLDPLCPHLGIRTWGRLSRTCKTIRKTLDSLLYWEGRFGEFKAQLLRGEARLPVYRSIVCDCVDPHGPRVLTGEYRLAVPVEEKVTTRRLMKHIVESIGHFNFEVLPHVARSFDDLVITVGLFGSAQPPATTKAGEMVVIPCFDRGQQDPSLEDTMLDTSLEDEILEANVDMFASVVEELDCDDQSMGAPCQVCGRDSDDDGFGDNLFILSF